MTFNYVYIEPYGSEATIAERYTSTLERYRTQHHAIIEPALGWGSQRVTSYTWLESGLVYRGILLQHLNAVTFVEILGRERDTSWDRLSSLTRIVERRLWDAVQ
jgi:hypothetical protein